MPVPDSSFSSPIRPQRTTHKRMTSDRKSRFSIDQGLHEAHSIMPSINILGDDRDNNNENLNPASLQHVGSILNIHELHCIKVKCLGKYEADNVL